MKTKGILYTIASAILFGAMPVIASNIYEMGVTPITLVCLRSLCVIPILFLLMKKDGEHLKLTLFQTKHIFLIAVLGSGLTTMLLFMSYQYIDVGTATTLHFLYPVVVALLCRVVYHEHLGKFKIAALLIAICGIFCFMDFSGHGSTIGLVMALCSSITYAFYMVQLEKIGLAKMNAFKLSMYLSVFIVMETLVYGLFVPGSISFDIPLAAYGYAFIIAIGTSFLAVVLLQRGIEMLGSTTASIFCLFEPITSVVTGYYFLNESLTILKILGCIIILGAVILLVYANKKRSMELEAQVVKEKEAFDKQMEELRAEYGHESSIT